MESRSWTRKSEKRTLGLIETEEGPNASEQILTVGRAVSQNSPNGPESTCSSYWVVTQHVVTREQPTHSGVSSDPSAGLVRGTILEPFWLNSYCCRTNGKCGSSSRFFPANSDNDYVSPHRYREKKLQTQTLLLQSLIVYLKKQLFLHHHRVRAKRNFPLWHCTGQSSAHAEIPPNKTYRRQTSNYWMNDTQIDINVFDQIFIGCFCFLAC